MFTITFLVLLITKFTWCEETPLVVDGPHPTEGLHPSHVIVGVDPQNTPTRRYGHRRALLLSVKFNGVHEVSAFRIIHPEFEKKNHQSFLIFFSFLIQARKDF